MFVGHGGVWGEVGAEGAAVFLAGLFDEAAHDGDDALELVAVVEVEGESALLALLFDLHLGAEEVVEVLFEFADVGWDGRGGGCGGGTFLGQAFGLADGESFSDDAGRKSALSVRGGAGE